MCKLPDGRDWQWEKLGLALVGRAMLSETLIFLSADGHLGCFYVLAIINSAAMKIGEHVSLSFLISSVCMPRSGIAG